MKSSYFGILRRAVLGGVFTGALYLGLVGHSEAATYSITQMGTAVTENFATWTGTTAPTGWTVTPVTNYQSNATSTGGGARRYSNSSLLGSSNVLGFLGNSGVSNYSASSTFSNDTGAVLTSLSISYTAVQFLGQASSPSYITVSYSINGGTAVQVTGLTFNAPVVTNSTTPSTAALTATITGLDIEASDVVTLTWNYVGGASGNGSRQGLGLTNVSVSGTGLAVTGSNIWNGGDGSWDTTASGGNWQQPYNSANPTIFTNGAGTITVSGAVSALAGMVFNDDGDYVTGGSINLAGSINVVSGATAYIDSSITGTSGLIKSGLGGLVVFGSNSFTGAINVNGGVLSISSDANLGAAGNDISLSGATLQTTSSISMDAGRNVSGAGNLDIADGTTLTVNGSFNMTAVDLTNTGVLDLEGSVRNLGALTLEGGATITGSGQLSATSVTATNLFGTSTFGQQLNLGAATSTINVGSSGTLVFQNGIVVTGSSSYLSKTGGGTMVISGSSNINRIQLGTSGSVNGGVLQVSDVSGLGNNQMYFNYGTLQATTALNSTIGLSVGGRLGKEAILAGSAMSFSGSTSIYESAGVETVMKVNNTTTLSGVIYAYSASTSGTGLTVGGVGTLVISNTANTYAQRLTVGDTATVKLNGNWASNVVVSSSATLTGNGTIAQNLEVAGKLNPGDGVGTLTVAGNVTLDSTSQVTMGISSTSNYDKLSIGSTLAYDGTLALNITTGLTTGTLDLFSGFTSESGQLVGLSATGFYNFSFTYDGSDLWTYTDTADSLVFSFSQSTGDLTISPVPEPGTLSLLAFAFLGGWIVLRRKKHLAAA